MGVLTGSISQLTQLNTLPEAETSRFWHCLALSLWLQRHLRTNINTTHLSLRFQLQTLKQHGFTCETIRGTWSNLNSSFNPFYRENSVIGLLDLASQVDDIERRLSNLSTLTRGRVRSNIHRINIMLGLDDEVITPASFQTMPSSLLLPNNSYNESQDAHRPAARSQLTQGNSLQPDPSRNLLPIIQTLQPSLPRVRARVLPPTPDSEQTHYDSPRIHRPRLIPRRPRSASLQHLQGTYLDMRAAQSQILYQRAPIEGTIV